VNDRLSSDARSVRPVETGGSTGSAQRVGVGAGEALAADGISQREIAARLGINRRAVRRMLESDEPQQNRRTPHGSMLDPLEPALRKLLED
jgi:hypothetical protein